MKNLSYTDEEKYYLNAYRGKTVILKISGAEIANPDFKKGAEQINGLIHQGIKFILIFGGGRQVDLEWAKKHPNAKRPKKDGIGITTQEVLESAVIPAYLSARANLAEFFKNSEFLNPDRLVAHIKDFDKYGYVGVADGITGLDKDAGLTVLGFSGKEKGRLLNINADEIIKTVINTHKEIAEIMMLTGSGGVLDIKGKIVPTLACGDIQKILKGENSHVIADGGMLKKLKEVSDLLESIDKVAIIHADQIKKELLTSHGAGTLCVKKAADKNAPSKPIA
jgi:bifunctional N-acetylglutamate synthase/kinase